MDLPDCFDCKFGGLEHPCRKIDGSYDFEKAGKAIVARGRLFGGDDEVEPDPAALEPTNWITDCEYELIEDHVGLILPLAIAAMDACETPHDAAFVAAGLMENALVKHGPVLIRGIEALARRSAKVRYILSGVWSQSGGITPDVWARLGGAIGRSGRMSNDGRSAHDGSPVHVLDEEAAQDLMRERVALAAAGLNLSVTV